MHLIAINTYTCPSCLSLLAEMLMIAAHVRSDKHIVKSISFFSAILHYRVSVDFYEPVTSYK